MKGRGSHGVDGGNGIARGEVAGAVVARAATRPAMGVLEWFTLGETARVERVLESLRALGVTRLRTAISWADWHTAEGPGWYEWLLPRLSGQVELLPCFLYTPPSLGVEPRVSAPPRRARDYADFVAQIIDRFGEHFDWVELWNEPNNLSEWDWSLDPGWKIFSAMVRDAGHWARRCGKRTVLGGMAPIDPGWLRRMHEEGVLEHVDAVGIHAFPGTFDARWTGWKDNVERVRRALRECGSGAEVWITEVGYSTWRFEEAEQARHFLEASEAPVERVYWYGMQDLHPDRATVDGFHSDDREYHFGVETATGRAKLLRRLWAERADLGAVREFVSLTRETADLPEDYALITGGAGFVGTNLAASLLEDGREVLLLDNLARPGVETNVRRLRERYGGRVRLQIADVRNRYHLRHALKGATEVYHLAGQVALTTSLEDPEYDFAVNAKGTLNLIEELRRLESPPPLLFTSTNKVYGDLEDVALLRGATRYVPADEGARERGVSEDRPVSFRSPYGTTKGYAEQAVLDAAASYGLPAVVFRMSCIYGPHQFGTEDQGWVAHFLLRAMEGAPITLFGDGRQVRDVLFVEDLVRAMRLARGRIEEVSGRAFNVGGGPRNTTSLVELIERIERLRGGAVDVRFRDWREGDQRWYVSDTRRLTEATGWTPRVSVDEGVRRLHRWLAENRTPRRRRATVSLPAMAAAR